MSGCQYVPLNLLGIYVIPEAIRPCKVGQCISTLTSQMFENCRNLFVLIDVNNLTFYQEVDTMGWEVEGEYFFPHLFAQVTCNNCFKLQYRNMQWNREMQWYRDTAI